MVKAVGIDLVSLHTPFSGCAGSELSMSGNADETLRRVPPTPASLCGKTTESRSSVSE